MVHSSKHVTICLRLLIFLVVVAGLVSCRAEPTAELAYKKCMKKQLKDLESKSKRRGPGYVPSDLRENIADDKCRAIFEACDEYPTSYECTSQVRRWGNRTV